MILKQSSTFMILLFSSIFFISCTQNDNPLKEEEVCTGDNYIISLDRYIKRISWIPVRNKYNVITNEFTYNEFNLLAKRTNMAAYDTEYLYEYQCSNKLGKINNNTYTYNSDGEPTSYDDNSGDWNSYDLTYNGKTILAKRKLEGDRAEFMLELNAANLIHKVSRVDSYSTFEYDLNGNLTHVKDYDLNNTLLNAYEIKYDDHPNPFYGQLESVYLIEFVHFFGSFTNSGAGLSRLKDPDNYSFPYFKNNIISIEETTSPAPYKFLFENEYTYDSQNYPIKIKTIVYGGYYSDFELEYN